MTILKAEVLAHVNTELDRSETADTLKEHLLAALKWLSLKDDFLWVETTVDTIIGRGYYSLPLDYKGRLITIRIADNTPLLKITFREYQVLVADETSDNRGEPTKYALHGGFWYAYPTPDAVYEATLFYPRFILESEGGTEVVDDIPFSDIYRDVIYAKTKAIVCRNYGLTDEQIKYETELDKLILPPLQKMIEREPIFVKCNDL